MSPDRRGPTILMNMFLCILSFAYLGNFTTDSNFLWLKELENYFVITECV